VLYIHMGDLAKARQETSVRESSAR
jgi:hypothetical protein